MGYAAHCIYAVASSSKDGFASALGLRARLRDWQEALWWFEAREAVHVLTIITTAGGGGGADLAGTSFAVVARNCRSACGWRLRMADKSRATTECASASRCCPSLRERLGRLPGFCTQQTYLGSIFLIINSAKLDSSTSSHFPRPLQC